jgi:hypothetical protein
MIPKSAEPQANPRCESHGRRRMFLPSLACGVSIMLVLPLLSLAIDNPCKFRDAVFMACDDPRCSCGLRTDKALCVGNRGWNAWTDPNRRRDFCSGTGELYLQQVNAGGCGAGMKRDTRSCLWDAGTSTCSCPQYDPNTMQFIGGPAHDEIICEQCPV